MINIKNITALLLIASLFYSCEEGGVFGNNGPVAVGHLVTITLEIKHHSRNMPDCKVGLKKNTLAYNSKDFSTYDEVAYSNSNGFLQLFNKQYGDYYFYVEGYDVAIADSVHGYLSLTVDSSTRVLMGDVGSPGDPCYHRQV